MAEEDLSKGATTWLGSKPIFLCSVFDNILTTVYDACLKSSAVNEMLQEMTFINIHIYCLLLETILPLNLVIRF